MPKRIFDHVLIIMFENQYRGYVMKNPYFRSLAGLGVELRNFYGVMHPSQTNYISSIAGELCDVGYDDQPPPLPQQTIVDLLESSNLRWRAYMDSYIPQNQPWTPELKPKDEFPYLIKHNPFSSFANIQNSQARWSRITNEAGFWSDLINDEFPEYAWFTPNMWNDGHYVDGTQTAPPERAPALVDQAALWLQDFFKRLRFPGPATHLPKNTLVVVTFDEADYEANWTVGEKYTYDGPNQIYTVLLGDCLTPSVQHQAYNHYSLLSTIERNFALGNLGKNDAAANCFEFLWDREFAWSAPRPLPFKAGGAAAITAFDGRVCALYKDADGCALMRMYTDDDWTEAWSTGLQLGDDFVLIALQAADKNDELLLADLHADGGVSVIRYRVGEGWQSPIVLQSRQPVRAVAMTTYDHGAMLVWAEADGALYSSVYSGGSWQTVVEVGHSMGDAIELAAIGPSLYLFIYDSHHRVINVASYNTAGYNVVTHAVSQYDGPWNNSVAGSWSKDLFPVARFGVAANSKTPGEPEPATQPYTARLPMAVTELNGVMYLLHKAADADVLMTASFSLAGMMTAQLPISYNEKLSNTTSNGYGTLAQAGWSEPQAIALADPVRLSACRCGEAVYVLCCAGKAASLLKGEYRQT